MPLLSSFLTLTAVEKMGEALRRRSQVLGPLWGFQALDFVVPGMWGHSRPAGAAEHQWVKMDEEGDWRQAAILFLLHFHGCAGQVCGDGLLPTSGCCRGRLGRRLDGT